MPASPGDLEMREPAARFKPRRRFGQNFLVNEGAIDTLIAAFKPAPADLVLEIGPGRGALTRRLLGRVARLTAVEVDRDLIAFLSEALPRDQAGLPAPRLIEADVLRLDLRSVLVEMGATRAHPARVIANLPYNIATAVILRLLEERDLIRDLLVMVQREVAARIMARPGSASYGGLSVLTQAIARTSSVLRLRPGSFRPKPKVDSEAIRLLPHQPGSSVTTDDPSALSLLVRLAFAHRRKTLLNNLRHLPTSSDGSSQAALGLERAGQLILQAGLDPGCRPEDVAVEGYLALLGAWKMPQESVGKMP